MDLILDSFFDLDLLGVEKSIFQHVANNSDLYFEEINLREPKIDKDQIEYKFQEIQNNIEDSNSL